MLTVTWTPVRVPARVAQEVPDDERHVAAATHHGRRHGVDRDPGGGAVEGLDLLAHDAGGIYPATRAARLAPAEAVRPA